MRQNKLKIAVLSGKGGTGKTLVSVNLSSVIENAMYIDCDVEEPNGHLFFKPQNVENKKITRKVPVVNHELCTGCRKCIEFCNFNAMAYINNKVMIFENICHSCGACSLFCPTNAITEKDNVIGSINKGVSNGVKVVGGILNIKEESGVPIINELVNVDFNGFDHTIIDCPPGSSCLVMESIQDADYCLLVAEPTLFGAHNLEMVYDLVRLYDKPYGVVLNKCLDGFDNPSEQFCIEINIPIMGKIPFDKELGLLNSNAKIVVNESLKFKEMFTKIYKNITEEVQK